MKNNKEPKHWWENKDYNVGDILVKEHGTKKVYTVVGVSEDISYIISYISNKKVKKIRIHDSSDNTEASYWIYDIATWTFLTHYPVLPNDENHKHSKH